MRLRLVVECEDMEGCVKKMKELELRVYDYLEAYRDKVEVRLELIDLMI